MEARPSSRIFGFDKRIALYGLLLWGLLAAAVTWIAGEHERERALTSMHNRLASLAQLRLEMLSQSLERYSQSLLFLADTPPVAGLTRTSLHNDLDLGEQSTSDLWRKRMALLFRSYAVTAPETLQLRLIGSADNARELVHVINGRNGPVDQPPAQLQHKGDTDYYRQALRLKAGEVYLSDIRLSHDRSQDGKEPPLPVLRLATPIYADGKLFAVMSINLDARHLLSYLRVGSGERNVRVYVTNQNGDFLDHPNPDKTFGQDRGKRWRWQDEFQPLPAPDGQDGLQRFQSSAGEVYTVMRRLELAPQQHDGRYLVIAEALPESIIAGAVSTARRDTLLSMCLGGLLVAALSWVYQRQRNRLHEQIRQNNASLENQVQQRTQEIQRYAALQRAILSDASYAIIATDQSGLVTMFNPAAETLLSESADEVVGRRHITDWLDLAELQELSRQLAQESGTIPANPFEALVSRSRSGQSNQLEWTVTASDGRSVPVSIALTSLRDDDGRLQGFLGMAADISAQQKYQRELMSARDQLGKAAEVAELGIWTWWLADNALELNTRMFEMYRYPPELRNQVNYQHWRDRLHPDDVEAVERELFDAVAGRGIYSPVFRIVLPDGRIRYIQAGALVERDDDGKPWRVTGINRDITEQHELEMTLRAAKESAEAASRAKADFLSNMSHEIRTPMNAVLGLAYLLEKHGLPAEALDLVRKIRIAGRSLQSIINDILDFSKIEAGNLEIEQAPFRLGDVLDNISTIMSANVGEREIELIIAPPPADINHLRGDALRLEQVLINLTSNAIKFTERGYVEVAIDVAMAQPQQTTLRFSVIDSGIGIPRDKQQELFEPFTQADASTTRRFGGTGLGLAISRRLVALMGGEIGLISTPGHGSEFWFTLTFPREPNGRLSVPEMAGLNVLIADDNPIAREALHITARELGWRVATVESGRQALQQVLEALGGQTSVDVVILDWKMPDMDGLEAAHAIRQACDGRHMPIILMATAYSREKLLAEPSADLITEVLNKPVTPSNLYNSVARSLRLRQGEAPVMPTGPGSRLEGLRLLVVDDSDINREVAQRIFEGEGARVSLAGDGKQALVWLAANYRDVDIVLMDVQMPVMDGYQATREIRATPELSHLPVVALTAGAFQTQQDAARAAGMTDYIAKPFDVEMAISQLRTLSGRNGRQEAPAPMAEPAGQAPLQRDLPGLAVSHGLEIWRDETVYRQYLRKFARDYSDSAATMRLAGKVIAQSLAHKLKGAAGNLALNEVSAAAGEVDQLLQEDEDATAAIDALQAALTQTLSSISRYAPAPRDAEPPAAKEADKDTLGPLLLKALAAFNADDPAAVEPVLQALEPLLLADQLSPLQSAVENFDFRGGEAAIRALAIELGLPRMT
ncbi:response regulator [Chromobacterium sp. ATCC 53434]|uniref:response regulator n=1 Tax=Chromobacterium sp. (strain ATCC 53434 / SC 14030) TaxID=2059672 RepID=UPI0013053EAB|nr:response regulator [Chromobacterium sp. ATCC 53434]